MAFGKAPDQRKFILPNREDQLFKAHVESEEIKTESWPEKWGWILDEYKDLKVQLNEVTKKSAKVRTKETPELRTLLPVPDTVNGEYGWVCTRHEFRLEKYGPDLVLPAPVPEE